MQSFANQEPPSWVESLKQVVNGDDLPTRGSHTQGIALGSMGTTGLNKKALAEGELAVQLYTDYFGPSSFKRLQLTQQMSCNFGQSWPELVWIPICYYFDTTVRHPVGHGLGRPRILESRDAARGCTSVVGTYSGLQFLP